MCVREREHASATKSAFALVASSINTQLCCCLTSRRYFVKVTALLDDGAVVYLNGIELGRVNMNKGAVTSNTWALSRISGRGGYTSHYLYGDDTVINNGVNVLAVEVSRLVDLAV